MQLSAVSVSSTREILSPKRQNMGTVISNLKARFGVDTKDFKNGLKDGEKAVDDFKGAAGSSIEKLADLFGVNMNAVNSALETSRRSMNFLAQSFAAGTKGANIMAVAMKVLRVALISTGVGALIVALGSLISYFKGTGEGADKFRVIMAKLRSVIDNLVDRLQTFGSGLVDIFSGRFRDGVEKIRGAFKGMGKEISEDWKLSGQLADAENELYRRETELITSLEERRQKMEELKLAARDQDKTLREQQAAQVEAMNILKSMTEDQVGLEEDRLRIMQEKLKISASDPTREQLREIADQEAKISQLKAGEARQMRELIEYYNTVTRKINENAAAQLQAAADAEKAWQSMINNAVPATPVLFDVSKISEQLAQVKAAVVPVISSLGQQLNSVFENSFETMLSGLGEFLGGLATGEASMQGFTQMVGGMFAQMAIDIGKVAIAEGVALKAIKAGLSNPANAPAVIAAGVALVALGSIVKGALSRIGSGAAGAGEGAIAAGSSLNFDTRLPSQQEAVTKIELSGKLTAEGDDLVYVFNRNTSRRTSTT